MMCLLLTIFLTCFLSVVFVSHLPSSLQMWFVPIIPSEVSEFQKMLLLGHRHVYGHGHGSWSMVMMVIVSVIVIVIKAKAMDMVMVMVMVMLYHTVIKTPVGLDPHADGPLMCRVRMEPNLKDGSWQKRRFLVWYVIVRKGVSTSCKTFQHFFSQKNYLYSIKGRLLSYFFCQKLIPQRARLKKNSEMARTQKKDKSFIYIYDIYIKKMIYILFIFIYDLLEQRSVFL